MTDESAPQQSQWRKDYYEYLLTSAWRAKRDLVMARAGGQCEGCRQRPATQVHHKRYPKGAEPGSDGWIAREKLFDLVAVCDECHTDIHFGGDAGDAGYSSLTDVVRFGRYEGRTIEEMLRDRNYRRWFLAQPNLRVDQPSLFAIIANGGIAQNRAVREQSATDVAGEARDELLRTFIWERSLTPLLLSWGYLFAGVYSLFEENANEDRGLISFIVLPRDPPSDVVSALIAETKADAIQVVGAYGCRAIVSEPVDGVGFLIQADPPAVDALRAVSSGFDRKFSALPEVARYVAAARADFAARAGNVLASANGGVK